jgi:hypothetical protein
MASGPHRVDPHVDPHLLARLGLVHGQTRPCAGVAHDTVWLTGDGREIGAGDLDGDDLARISRRLADDERLLVVDAAARRDADWWGHLRWIVEPSACWSVTPWATGPRRARLADEPGCGPLHYQIIGVADAVERLAG